MAWRILTVTDAGGVATDVVAAPTTPCVPDGETFKAIYPYSPIPPQRSVGYPTHLVSQLPVEVVVSGT